jgi:hypothetical protein
MTEKSFVWNALPAAGDTAFSPYGEDVWADIWGTLFTKDMTKEGVISEYLSSLLVTGSTSPVSIGTGAALVYGTFYENDAVYSLAIPTPAVSTRIDVVVLRKDWAAKTVRIGIVSGVEGGGVPALTQTIGATWEISIAEVSITIAGAITVTDSRSYLPGQGYTSNPSVCSGRLTLTSGVPVTVTDVLNAATIYFTPYIGNIIALYNGAKWLMHQFVEIPLDISGLAANTLYDVFIYNNAGTLALEALSWNPPSTSTVVDITNASPRVVSTPSTTGIVAGELVTIKGNSYGGNNTTWRIGTVVVNTSFQLLNLDGTNSGAPGSIGTEGDWVKKYDIAMTRAVALTMVNGVYLKTGATTRRYLGTILIGSTGGVTSDTMAFRFVWNYYNRVMRSAIITYTGTHTYSTAAYRIYNNDLTYIVPFIIGVSDEQAEFIMRSERNHSSAASTSQFDLQIDTLGTRSRNAQNIWDTGAAGASDITFSMQYFARFAAGLHIGFPAQHGDTVTITWKEMYAAIVQEQ